MGVTDHVRFRNELDAEQLRQGRRIDGVSLDLGVADGLEILGVAEAQVNPLGHQQIAQPVPHPGALDDRLMRARERREVGSDALAVGRQVRLADEDSRVVDGMDGDRALVEVDPGEQHDSTPTRGDPKVWSLGLVGNITRLQRTGRCAARR